MTTNPKGELDYIWIGMICIMCLTFSAVGYGFMVLTQSLSQPNQVGVIFIIILPIVSGLMIGKASGIRKEKSVSHD